MSYIENSQLAKDATEGPSSTSEACEVLDALMAALDHVAPGSHLESILLTAIERAAKVLEACGTRST